VTFKNQLASLDTRTKQYLSSRYIFAISENDGSLGQMFGVTSTPTSFILNQKKQLLVQPMIGEPQIIDEFVTYLIAVSKS
jgi:protein-disulfide isomerase